MNPEGKNYQLPSNLVAREFGEVNVLEEKEKIQVLFTILMEPSGKEAEGWQTAIALDASTSMKWAYGKKLEGTIPSELKAQYESKGWFQADKQDGLEVKYVKKEAIDDAVKRGHLKHSLNVVEPLAREFIAYLASSLDSRGKTNVTYWACGEGDAYENIGIFSAEECPSLSLEGPRGVTFGRSTCLTPLMKYFAQKFQESPRTIVIFLTDGHLDDFEEVKNYTLELALDISEGKRNLLKFVLVGVGDEISREQLQELDDLDTKTDIDLWDHKIAQEMRSLVEIFAEVVDEHQIVAPMATIYNEAGEVVKKFSDGLPAKVSFEIDKQSSFFDLVVGEHQIRQVIRL